MRTVLSYEKNTCMAMQKMPKPRTYSGSGPPTNSRAASPMAPMSAAMLIVLATTSRVTSAVVSQRGHILSIFAASPSPVTQPMRADSIWMPIISGVVSNSVQTSEKRNLYPACE